MGSGSQSHIVPSLEARLHETPLLRVPADDEDGDDDDRCDRYQPHRNDEVFTQLWSCRPHNSTGEAQGASNEHEPQRQGNRHAEGGFNDYDEPAGGQERRRPPEGRPRPASRSNHEATDITPARYVAFLDFGLEQEGDQIRHAKQTLETPAGRSVERILMKLEAKQVIAYGGHSSQPTG